MKDLTNVTESSTPPIIADGPACSICGKPMNEPREIGAALKAMLDKIRRSIRERIDPLRAAGADEATVDALVRESVELWCRYLFPELEEFSAELMGAHAECVIKATEERRKGAS